MAQVGIAIAVIGGLLLASRFLLRKPPDAPDNLGEDTPPTISTRGSWVPLYFGTRKTEKTVIGWAGNRTTTQESTGSGGGKGGGGGGDAKQTIFHEEVWHLLGVGPATHLHEIRFNGKIIWQGPIDSETSPSGTEISVGAEGSFKIYWGEETQPINLDLGDASRVGVSSRWPRLCYIYWTRMRYGTSPAQPQVEYVLSWECEGQTLSDSEYILDDEESRGVNGAHILHTVLNSGPFTGAKIGLDEIDNDSLEDLGVLLESEHLPCNMEFVDGSEARRAVEAILQDMGVQMPVVDARLTFIPQRYDDEATLPELTDDEIAPPTGKVEVILDPGAVTRPVFTIKDEEGFNYRDQDIPLDDDGDASEFGLSTATRVPITTVTHLTPGSKVANRRWQESTAKSNIVFKVLRGARLLVPGQAFIREGLGQLRVTGVKPSDETPETEITCTLDSYAIPDIDDVLAVPGSGGSQLAPAADIDFKLLEVPSDLQIGAQTELVVVRVRAHKQIFTAGVYLSTDSTTYQGVGDQVQGQGGLLEEAITTSPIDIIPEGPKFEPDNEDITQVLDLTSNITAWQSGKQIGVINDEVFFIQSFSPVDEDVWMAEEAITAGDFRRPIGSPNNLRFEAHGSGNTGTFEPTWPTEVGETVVDGDITWEARRFAYRPLNMIRARYASVVGNHSIGDRLFIADADTLVRFSIGGLTPGQGVCAKTQPRTSGGSVDLATVTPDCITITGDPSDTTVYRITDSGPRVTATGEVRTAG